MGELGDVLELLHGAARRFDRVSCEYRTWRHDPRSLAAHLSEPGGVTFAAYDSEPAVAPPPEREGRIRLWRDGREKVRCEHEDDDHGSRLEIRVGQRWWSYDDHDGALSNEGDESVSTSVGQELSVVLDPARVMALLDFRVLGPAVRAGREVIRATARPRPVERSFRAFDLHALGSGADEYELEVDAERGVLLRVEARREGEPYSVLEALRIEFDGSIEPETFVFEPPAGEEVRRFGAGQTVHRIPLYEAVAQAPFEIFVPERVPRDWELDVMWHPGTTRPPSEPTLTLFYRARDGTSGASISQASEAGGELDFPEDETNWQDVESAGVQMRLRPRAADWPQSQLRVVRDGTQITMVSNDLDGNALVRLAASLVPAPRQPPAI